MNQHEIAELFARPLDPETEERALRAELAAMMRRHRAAAKPISDRLTQLARANGATVIHFPGVKSWTV